MVAIFVGRMIEAAGRPPAVIRAYIVIIGPTPVLGAGNHHHPKKLRALANLTSGNDERGSMLTSLSIRVGKRHTDNIPLLKGWHRLGDRLRNPIRQKS